MLTADGPKLIEYNVRFGDPECQVLMLRLKSDLLAAMLAACDGVLESFDVRWSDEAALTVVMAAKGYPGAFETRLRDPRPRAAEALDGVHRLPRRHEAGRRAASRRRRPRARRHGDGPDRRGAGARLRGGRRDRLAGGLLPPRHRLARGRRGFDLALPGRSFDHDRLCDLFPGFESQDRHRGRPHLCALGRRGPPLVLLHGFPQTHAMWHHIAPALGETHRVVCLDLRGYGWSSSPRAMVARRPTRSAPWARTWSPSWKLSGMCASPLSATIAARASAIASLSIIPGRVERLASSTSCRRSWFGSRSAPVRRRGPLGFFVAACTGARTEIVHDPIPDFDGLMTKWSKDGKHDLRSSRARISIAELQRTVSHPRLLRGLSRRRDDSIANRTRRTSPPARTIACPVHLVWSDFYLARGGAVAPPLDVWRQELRAGGLRVHRHRLRAISSPRRTAPATLASLKDFLRPPRRERTSESPPFKNTADRPNLRACEVPIGGADWPLPACGERVPAFGRTSGAKRSGGEGAVQKEAPSLAAAPSSPPPPHPRLLRRLAAFGGPPPRKRGEVDPRLSPEIFTSSRDEVASGTESMGGWTLSAAPRRTPARAAPPRSRGGRHRPPARDGRWAARRSARRSPPRRPSGRGRRNRAGGCGEGDRPRAHRAWLERDVEVAIGQAIVAERRAGPADGEHLGMGRGSLERARAVAGGGKDSPVPHDGRADGDLAGAPRGAGLGEGRPIGRSAAGLSVIHVSRPCRPCYQAGMTDSNDDDTGPPASGRPGPAPPRLPRSFREAAPLSQRPAATALPLPKADEGPRAAPRERRAPRP